MKKIKYGKTLLLLACTWFAGCEEEEGFRAYSVDNVQTELGRKIIEGSDGYVGQLFSDSTYILAPGVTALEMEVLSAKGLSIKMFLLEIDLKDSHLSIKASSANDDNKLGVLQKMTLQALAKDKEGERVLAAVNGDFFNKENKPQGIFYKNGVCLNNKMADNICTFFAVSKDKKAFVGSYETYDSHKDNIQEAVGGRVRLITNGNVLPQTNETLEPRTAIGVTDNNVVYILVVDGRNFWYSNGMRYAEMASVMKSLGVQNAINLDGGGSSTFIIRNTIGFTDNRFCIRNWPYDKGGQERAVANGLLVITDN